VHQPGHEADRQGGERQESAQQTGLDGGAGQVLEEDTVGARRRDQPHAQENDAQSGVDGHRNQDRIAGKKRVPIEVTEAENQAERRDRHGEELGQSCT
jgi:hypothetical protein